MSDEIEYLKAELFDISSEISNIAPDLDIEMASVFYKCFGNDFVTKASDFSTNISKTVDFIRQQSANGGGLEAVEEALKVAVNDLQWNKNARTKIMFLILDEPPGSNSSIIEKLQKNIKIAAAKGIRIVPIVSSGMDKSGEYLMRSFALATNGTYLFLTDDSGIGAKHIKPTTDEFEVELLNDLIVRIIENFIYVPPCELPNMEEVAENESENTLEEDKKEVVVEEELKSDEAKEDISDEIPVLELKLYPNPCKSNLFVEAGDQKGLLFLTDLSGKILERIPYIEHEKAIFDMQAFPNGIYFVRFVEDDPSVKPITEKVIVAH